MLLTYQPCSPLQKQKQLCAPENLTTALFGLVLSPAPYAKGPRRSHAHPSIRSQTYSPRSQLWTLLAHEPVPAPLGHSLGAPGVKPPNSVRLQILKRPCNSAPAHPSHCPQSCWHRNPAGEIPVYTPRDPERAPYLPLTPSQPPSASSPQGPGPQWETLQSEPPEGPCTGLQPQHSFSPPADLPARDPVVHTTVCAPRDSEKDIYSVPGLPSLSPHH